MTGYPTGDRILASEVTRPRSRDGSRKRVTATYSYLVDYQELIMIFRFAASKTAPMACLAAIITLVATLEVSASPLLESRTAGVERAGAARTNVASAPTDQKLRE